MSAAGNPAARPGPTVRTRLRALDDGRDVLRRDDVATEEPLEIRLAAGVQRRTVAVTMRTPGHDFELAIGYLVGEGVLDSPDRVTRVDYCTDLDVAAEQQYNIVTVTLTAGILPELDTLDRHGYVSSACGVCGKDSIDALTVRCAPVRRTRDVEADALYALPDALRGAQGVFARTGGLHAAGLATADGELQVVREDVGRHNAVDKVVGATFTAGALPATDAVLVVSGRTSFEIVQKAVAAGIGTVAGVSAPSSLAIATAEQFGVTLVGFLRGRRANVYSHVGRIRVPEPG